MQRIRSSFLVSGAVLLLAASAAADVIVVSQSGAPGTLPTVQAGVDAAVDGDVVLVEAGGIYEEDVVVAGRSIALIGDVGEPPRLRSLLLRDLPVGGQLVVRGLRANLASNFVDTGITAVRVLDCAGSVRLETVGGNGSHGTSGSVNPFTSSVDAAPGLTVTNCADVALHDCAFLGGFGTDLFDEDVELNPSSGASGVIVIASHVSADQCVMLGGAGGGVFDTVTDAGGAGGDGLRNVSGTVFISNSLAFGGPGGSGDCDILIGICGAGGTGGNGVRQDEAAAALYLRYTATYGAPGGESAQPGGDGLDGLDVRISAGAFTRFHALARQFSTTSPAREASTFVLTAAGPAGDGVFLLTGLQLGQLVSPPYQGAFLLLPPFGIPEPFPLGIMPGAGTMLLTITVPALPEGLQAATFHMQSLFLPASSSQPLAGPWSAVTILDSSF